jgi:hypothetical protein
LVTVSASSTNVSCNGLANGTITASGSVGSVITIDGLAPAATYGPGLHTIVATAPNGNANGNCTATTTVTITKPSLLIASCSRSNANLYYGMSGDQTSKVYVTPSGGVGPYTVSITMNRQLLLNQAPNNANETWNKVITSTTTDGSPTWTSTVGGITAGSEYSVTVGLMASAVFTIKVIDKNGCTATCTTSIYAEDVRCFAGKSGNAKVKICHQTGSSKNPCTEICVDESAVASHLAHGDFLGSCTSDCMDPKLKNRPVVIGKEEIIEIADFKILAYPNPSNYQFNLNVIGGTDEQVEVVVYDMLAREVKRITKPNAKEIQFGEELPSGEYLLLIRQGSNQKAINVIKK